MGFDILNSNLPEKVYPGMIISYTVRPLWGFPMTWVTEITQVDEPNYFIDNQKSGPYAFWHHQHFFKAVEGGVEMTDIINYKVPFGFIGRLIENFLVEKKVRAIFDYRKSKLESIFS